jgi:homoserine acetyltransferase
VGADASRVRRRGDADRRLDGNRRHLADRGLDVPERQSGLESDPIWVETGGDYYDLPRDQHPRQGSAFHWSVLTLTGYDLAYRQSQGWDAVKPNVFAWDPPEEGFGATVATLGDMFDAVDLKYRVEVGETHNINALLPEYQPRTLVIHIENDMWLPIDKARDSVALIPGAQIATETSPIPTTPSSAC